MPNKLMIVMVNTDPTNGAELGAPFFQAAVAAAMEYDVEAILTARAGELAIKGVAEKLHVQEGSPVRKGQLLLKIDDRELQAQLKRKILEEKLGVTAAAPMAMAAVAMPGAGAAAAPAEAEEKTEFDVLLNEVGAKKIQVIKVVRQLTNLGLREAKDLGDGAPSTVLTAVTKEVAEDAKSKLEAEGATVGVK